MTFSEREYARFRSFVIFYDETGPVRYDRQRQPPRRVVRRSRVVRRNIGPTNQPSRSVRPCARRSARLNVRSSARQNIRHRRGNNVNRISTWFGQRRRRRIVRQQAPAIEETIRQPIVRLTNLTKHQIRRKINEIGMANTKIN